MFGSRNWVGNLLLENSCVSLRSIRNVPFLGDIVHRISHRVLPRDERVWAQIETGPAKGLWIELNPRTGQSYLRGNAEAAVQRVLVERLRAGMVFYDLGANIGFFSLLAARIVGPTGQVFSFEPDPETTVRLQRNVDQNNLQNVTVVPKGVWSTSGKRTFMAAGGSSPDHGTGKFVDDTGEEGGAFLDCVALDDFIRDAPAPHAIKCDVEGAEEEVLRGAERVLRTHLPWVLCELHSERSARSVRELLDISGYKIERVDSGHIFADVSKEN